MSNADEYRQFAADYKAAKASEMAGQELDLLGDPSATDEERQLRKQRLIKGPEEFRDIRSNRARFTSIMTRSSFPLARSCC